MLFSSLAAVLCWDLNQQYCIFLMKSRADSTTRKYVRAFQRWKEWANSMEEIEVFPCHFALYLQHLAITSKSRATIEEAINTGFIS